VVVCVGGWAIGGIHTVLCDGGVAGVWGCGAAADAPAVSFGCVWLLGCRVCSGWRSHSVVACGGFGLLVCHVCDGNKVVSGRGVMALLFLVLCGFGAQ
jgi:hypothetical protein